MPQIHIKVDTYMTEVSYYISEEDLELIRPLIEAIKNFDSYTSECNGIVWDHDSNYPFGDCLREDLGEKSPQELYPQFDEEVFEVFEEYVPPVEYGFHSIEEIMVYPDIQGEKLL